VRPSLSVKKTKEQDMTESALFNTDENKTLIAICTRKLISNIGIGAIIWGLANTVLSALSLQASILNIGLLIIGMLMLGVGIKALSRPSLGVLLAETIVMLVLFVWNVAIAILNYQADASFEPRGIVFPLVVACTFASQYRKLVHLREHIESVEPEKIKTTKQMCKMLLKKKLKTEPQIIQSHNRKCRAQLLDEQAFFIQRDLMRAVVGSKEDIRAAIVKPEAKTLLLHFNHPAGKIKYLFDKTNSAKLNNWLSTGNKTAID
jgi:hypothetical protein